MPQDGEAGHWHPVGGDQGRCQTSHKPQGSPIMKNYPPHRPAGPRLRRLAARPLGGISPAMTKSKALTHRTAETELTGMTLGDRSWTPKSKECVNPTL